MPNGGLEHQPPTHPRRRKTRYPEAPKSLPTPEVSPPPEVRPPPDSHKPRARWFQARAAWPGIEAPVSQLVKAKAQAATLGSSAKDQAWEFVGPMNVAGRMTSLVVDPGNPDRILAGAAAGGVWRSDDGGRSWRPTWRKRECNIGALALDPQNPKVVYCGTGEANRSVDAYGGVGLYKSIDWGKNWRLVAPTARTGLPLRIGTLAVDPFDWRHVRLGGIGLESWAPGGLHVSRDGGYTWQRETFISERNYWCHSLQFHPKKPGWIYCAVTARGAMSGIWRSTDGGTSWEHLTKGLPASEWLGRTSLAIAPSHPNVLYALTATEDYDAKVLEVFRSDDGGDTWQGTAGDAFREESNLDYANVIAVHPTDSDQVICGGVDLHASRDGGRTWDRLTYWDVPITNDAYAHADHHALLIHPAVPDRIYSANDGGVAVSMDAGHTWSMRSQGLTTTMFYDVDVAATDGSVFGGGAQDNGTLVTRPTGPHAFTERLGGDGGWLVFDPKDAGHFFASYQYMHVFRFRDGKKKSVTPPAGRREREAVWMAILTPDPEDARILYAGSTRIWRTLDDGDSWKPISDHFDYSAITAIEVAASDRNRIYAATANGGFFRSEDGGSSWSPNTAGTEVPEFYITRIECHPRNADVLYITLANWSVSHLFRSDDGGRTWVDRDDNHIPDAPLNAVALRTDDPESVFVAGDVGVFASSDGGESWTNFTGNLPPVPVKDLVYHERDGTLTAATYGRGIWRIRVRSS